METTIDDEFQPVDHILRSDHRTKGVDAFTLTYLRAERQVRKLFTHLVFQSEAFNLGNSQALREALYRAPDVSFKKLSNGIHQLAGVAVPDLVGGEFGRLFTVLREAKQYRDKLFHGQLPDQYLSTEKFFELEADIRSWCRLLATGAERDIGYGGFGDSHSKRGRAQIVKRVTGLLPDIAAYGEFLKRLN